ncbi:DUF559 domain-containing protein [Bifidobacterium sp.]|uniref:DUF559 domain-containing protein n=1 Tax=Bifidobacterium sp. TaxID=41200 RepID=UPI0025BD497F|nr:DUF559 domain-containing protein [Bifidobacterium sp.]MCH4208942.1 endonuclease domain-containing protein [Bifidobacterium sp.]MCI1225527.1 endonuclease domain-containing protein [Bifidobacterium sp.]
MQIVSRNTFFTLDEAQRLAGEQRLACAQVVKRTKRPLIFSHITLLKLCGMSVSVPSTLDSTLLHVTANSAQRLSHLRGVQNHLWTSPMTTTQFGDGIAGVSVEQAVCQMAAFCDRDSMVIIMDWLTCNNPDMKQTTHEDLADFIYSSGPFRGVRVCKEALPLSVEGTDSPQETHIRLKFPEVGLPVPEVNPTIIDTVESNQFQVDMAYLKQQVIIEYDGEYHYARSRWVYDLHKRNRLQSLGWKVFVATKAVFSSEASLHNFVMMVADALALADKAIRQFGRPNW